MSDIPLRDLLGAFSRAVSATLSVSPAQDAFVRLRAYAFAHDRPLSEVARDVVARRLVFSEDMA